ncbi:uncharacterized protein [Amphiura filiformis]|uniref:uncharacterized protein n=1 Tax=Amphiura filiformis TaxID=82378 RepID=UPI003B2187C4
MADNEKRTSKTSDDSPMEVDGIFVRVKEEEEEDCDPLLTLHDTDETFDSAPSTDVQLEQTRLYEEFGRYQRECVSDQNIGKEKQGTQAGMSDERVKEEEDEDCDLTFPITDETFDSAPSTDVQLEQTKLYIETTLILDEILNHITAKKSYHQIHHDALLSDVMKAIAAKKSVTLKNTPRLCTNVKNFVCRLLYPLQKARKLGGTQTKRFFRNVRQKSPWRRLTVLADEFEIREEFERCQSECAIHEAKVVAEIEKQKEAKKLMTASKDAAVGDEEETDEDNAPLRTYPFVEKDKNRLEDIRICDGPQTRLIESMEDFESCPGEIKEEFEKCQRECAIHEAKVATDIEKQREAENSLMVAEEDADEMTDEEEVNEESVPLRTCPFAEKEKINLYVTTDFVFEEIRKPNGKRKPFGDLVEDIVNALCRHNSVKLKKTPRLMHQVKKYVSELVGKKRKGKRDMSSSNMEDSDQKQPWECMVLADEFESRDDFVRCQRNREDTNLHVEPYFLLKQIKNADPKLTYQELIDFIFQQICSYKSVTLHKTPRLMVQVRSHTGKMKRRLKTERGRGGANLPLYMDNIGRNQPWSCKVLANEFVYREEFERCRREAVEYDAQVQAEKDAKMVDKEDINEESVPLRTCPFAEKEKINLDVVTNFVFEEIRKPNGKRKPFGELVEDVMNALCQNNSVRLKTTPRLMHQVKKYVFELVGKGKKGKGKRDESSSNMEDIDTQQPWECMVLADEFVSRDDFVRCQRNREDTNLHVEPYFLLKQIKNADPKFSYQELIDFIFQQICSYKSVTLHKTPRLMEQVRSHTGKMKSRLKTERGHGGGSLHKYMDNVGRYPPWTCKVLANEFVYREEFERCRREAVEYEVQFQAEKDAKMVDKEKINVESVPLGNCPFAEKEKITLDVVTDFVFEEIRKPNGKRKPFGELVEDVVNALCQNNSVRLKTTPRLMHQVKKYVSELVGKGKKGKGKRDESSSNMEDIDTQQPWECMVLADEFVNRDDFVRCQRMREETNLHVEPYFLLMQIKSAEPKFSYQELIDFIFQQICSHKSVTLHKTPRLMEQVKSHTGKMKSQIKTARGSGSNLRKYIEDTGKRQPWSCKVWANEFVYREEFERCRREAVEYEIQVQAEKDAKMVDKEKINAESVPLGNCPFAEKEKLTLDVVTDFVFEEIRKPNGKRKPFGELVEDVVNALCQNNSVRLKTTPRLMHQVKKYVSELVGKGKKGKGKRDESSSNMEDSDTQQPWECMVLADEFVSRDDFERCQRVREDTNLLVEPYFLLKQIKSGDPKLTYQELIEFIFQQICSHKSVTLHKTPRLMEQVKSHTGKMKSQIKTARGSGSNLRKYIEDTGKKQPWTCKVWADEFVYREEFERCQKEAAEYKIQVQAEREEKRRLAMEDEERRRAEEEADEEGSLPLCTYPLAGTTLESKEEDIEDVDDKDTSDESSTEDSSSDDSSSEDSSSDDSSSEDSSSDDSSDTDSLETHRKRKRKKKSRKWVRCPFCKWKFQKEIQLDLHIQWHLKHVCCTCGLTFATKSMLKEHRNNAHQVKRSCGCRPLKNKRSKRFKKWKQKHVCQLCGKAYDMLYLLRKHRSCALSIQLNNIKCCICYHGYKSPADLKHHKEVFHPAGYKLSTFCCKHCRRHFSEFQKYRSHVIREQKKYRKFWIRGIRKRNSPQEGVSMINQSKSPQTLPNSVTPNILYHSLSDTQRRTLGMAYLRYLIHQQSGNNEQSMNGIASNALSNMARRTSQNSPQPPWINVRGPNHVPTQVPTQGLHHVGAIGIDSANIQPHRLFAAGPVSVNSTNVQQEVVLTLNLASVNSPNGQPQGLLTSSVNNNRPHVQPQGLASLSVASVNRPHVQPQGLPTLSVASVNNTNVQDSHQPPWINANSTNTPSFIGGPNHVPMQVSTEALPHVGTIGIVPHVGTIGIDNANI